jgi:hypothetical protein
MNRALYAFIGGSAAIKLLLGIFVAVALADGLMGYSFRCSKVVDSEQEARKAIASFFSSDARRPRDLIDSLRKDGMTTEYLDNLKAGCGVPGKGCYVFRGDSKQNYNPNRWYAIAHIAPRDAHKSVVLEVECAEAIWLDHTLYGG